MGIVKKFVNSVKNGEYKDDSFFALVVINRIKKENKLKELEDYLEEKKLELSYNTKSKSFSIQDNETLQ